MMRVHTSVLARVPVQRENEGAREAPSRGDPRRLRSSPVSPEDAEPGAPPRRRPPSWRSATLVMSADLAAVVAIAIVLGEANWLAGLVAATAWFSLGLHR